MKSRGENRAVLKGGLREMARSRPEIRTVVTNDPGRRDRRASRKLFDTLLCPAFPYTPRPSFTGVSPSRLFVLRGEDSSRGQDLSVHTRRLLFHGGFPGSRARCKFVLEFLPGKRCFDRTQETVKFLRGVRVTVIRRLRDTGTDGSLAVSDITPPSPAVRPAPRVSDRWETRIPRWDCGRRRLSRTWNGISLFTGFLDYYFGIVIFPSIIVGTDFFPFLRDPLRTRNSRVHTFLVSMLVIEL